VTEANLWRAHSCAESGLNITGVSVALRASVNIFIINNINPIKQIETADKKEICTKHLQLI
jgi:hypothetical protein